MEVSVQNIANLVAGRVIGNKDLMINSPCKIEEGRAGAITFLASSKYSHFLQSTDASAVLISEDLIPDYTVKPSLIIVDNVYLALSKLMEAFNPTTSIEMAIASTAIVSNDVKIDNNVAIDHHTIVRPGASIGEGSKLYGQVFIGDRVQIGKHTIIYAGVKIYHDCIIGDHCVIHANTVIGSDGFGFAKESDGTYKKIPQIGNVIIKDRVEIGSNVVIDRASMGSTIIETGVKLDNLIQIAHNVIIGENTAIAAQSGIAGSTKVGKDCLIGGQVGIAGHLSIANNVMIQAQSGIASSVEDDGAKLYGSPALPYSNYLKSYAIFKNLPNWVTKWKKMEADKTIPANSKEKA